MSDLCSFKTRSKFELNTHMQEHPKCHVCQQICVDDQALFKHIEDHEKIQCAICRIYIHSSAMKDHVASHAVSASYCDGLDNTIGKKVTKSKEPSQKPR